MRFGKVERLTAPLIVAGLPCFIGQADPLAFDVGPVLFRPQVGLKETFNDNVFYTQDNTRSDLVTTISPGIGVSIGQKDGNHADLEYSMPTSVYSSDSVLNFIGQNLGFNGKFETDRLSIIAVESFVRTRTVLGAESELVLPVNYNTYGDAIAATYEVSPKTGVYARGTFTSQTFQNGLPLIDYEDFRETVGASYSFSPKTALFAEGYTGQIFTKSEDLLLQPSGPRARYYGGFIGVAGELASRLTFNVKGGYELRDFADGTSAPNAIAAEVSLMYNFNERTSATLSYRRSNQASTVYADTSYLQDFVTASVTQKFGAAEKLEATFGIVYISNAYERIYSGRVDEIFMVNASAKYHFKDWLTGSVGYEMITYSSNAGIRPYWVDKVFVMVNVGYPMISR